MSKRLLVEAHIDTFKETYCPTEDDDKVFELFANSLILNRINPYALETDPGSLDSISTGGSNDLGIDGIIILANNQIIKNLQDFSDIIAKSSSVSVEFNFIQAKNKSNFETREFLVFAEGIKTFFETSKKTLMNDKIANFFEIKQQIYDRSTLMKLNELPICRAYYITMSDRAVSEHLRAAEYTFVSDMGKMECVSPVNVSMLACDDVLRASKELGAKLVVEFPITDSLSFDACPGVTSSSIIFFNGRAFFKALSNDDGSLRRSLYNDNVRDFQGMSGSVNKDIFNSMKAEPEKFALLNNGLTIVCKDYKINNRMIYIDDPQIVNGCQTSSVLHEMVKLNPDGGSIPISAKIIATESHDLINKIVLATNNQNIVYRENLESTKEFHKDLENYFTAVSNKNPKSFLLYERRSRQFDGDSSVGFFDKVSLPLLAKSFVSSALSKPHFSNRHLKVLLDEFDGTMFNADHCFAPYFISASIFIKVSRLVRSSPMQRDLRPFVAHLSMVMRHKSIGRKMDLRDRKRCDEQLDKYMDVLFEEGKFEKIYEDSVKVLQDCTDIWISKMKRSNFGRADVGDFSVLLRDYTDENYSKRNRRDEDSFVESFVGETAQKIGVVQNVIIDKLGSYAAFISSGSKTFFCHSKENPGIDFTCIKGMAVSFVEVPSDVPGRHSKAMGLAIREGAS